MGALVERIRYTHHGFDFVMGLDSENNEDDGSRQLELGLGFGFGCFTERNVLVSGLII